MEKAEAEKKAKMEFDERRFRYMMNRLINETTTYKYSMTNFNLNSDDYTNAELDAYEKEQKARLIESLAAFQRDMPDIISKAQDAFPREFASGYEKYAKRLIEKSWSETGTSFVSPETNVTE